MAFDTVTQRSGDSDWGRRAAASCIRDGENSNGQSGQVSWFQRKGLRRSVGADNALVYAGTPMRSVYSVTRGLLKACAVDIDGNERIRAFYLPGDLIGLDAWGEQLCPATIMAIIPSHVYAVPMAELKTLLARDPALTQNLLERASGELSSALALAGDFSADQRLAAFLLDMRNRSGGGDLHLEVSQRDIGAYLRMTNETVCRKLKEFQRKGWIVLGRHIVRFLNEHALSRLANPVGLHHRNGGWERAA